MPTKWPITTNEVAARLGVTPRTIRKEIADGVLTGFRVRRNWRFARPNLVAYKGEDVVKNLFDDQDGPE